MAIRNMVVPKENLFTVDECMSIENFYMVRMPESIYELCKGTSGSYNILMARVFGLSYANFLRLARDNYNAILQGKNGGYIIPLFKLKTDAEVLARELTKRYNELLIK